MDPRTVVTFPLQDTAAREDLGMLAVMEALAADEEVTQRGRSCRSGPTTASSCVLSGDESCRIRRAGRPR